MKKNIKYSIQTKLFILLVVISFLIVFIQVLFKGKTDDYTNNSSDIITNYPSGRVSTTEAITLRKGESIQMNQSITIKLIESDLTPPDCRDCIESANLEVTKDSKTQMIEFKFGGIVGYVVDRREAFGYLFTIKELKEDRVLIEYKEINSPK